MVRLTLLHGVITGSIPRKHIKMIFNCFSRLQRYARFAARVHKFTRHRVTRFILVHRHYTFHCALCNSLYTFICEMYFVSQKAL